MDSTFFRVTIAISGLMLIAGLFLWEWLHQKALKKTEELARQQRQREFAEVEELEFVTMRTDVTTEGNEIFELPSIKAERLTAENRLSSQETVKACPQVIQLSVVAEKNSPFEGEQLIISLEELGLALGEMGIYHRHFDPQNSDRFSIANLMEPGTFPSDRLQPFSTPGVVFFLETKEQQNPLIVFDELVQSSRLLAKKMGGRLLDEKHHPLTEEHLPEIRKLIVNK